LSVSWRRRTGLDVLHDYAVLQGLRHFQHVLVVGQRVMPMPIQGRVTLPSLMSFAAESIATLIGWQSRCRD